MYLSQMVIYLYMYRYKYMLHILLYITRDLQVGLLFVAHKQQLLRLDVNLRLLILWDLILKCPQSLDSILSHWYLD